MIRQIARPAHLPDRHFLLDIDFDGWKLAGYGPVTHFGGRTIAVSGIVSSDVGGLIGVDRHEAISHAYQSMPNGFTRTLLGQYSAVVVDPDERRIIVAQDSIGLGRIFIHRHDTRLLVASDLGALCTVLRPEELDQRYFGALLSLGVALPGYTPFPSVRALSGGLLEVHKHDSWRSFRPWTPQNSRLKIRHDEAVLRVRTLIDEAVRSFVPTSGTVMSEVSGGLDSGTVVSTAVKLEVELEGIIYASPRGMAGNDMHFANRLADHLGIRLNVVDPDAHGIVRRTRSFVAGEPAAELYIEAIDAQDRILRDRGIDVLLTGTVGDIVFDYSGLTPVFLADSVSRLNIPKLLRDVRRYATSNDDYRSSTHYLKTVAFPFAWLHWRRRSLFQEKGIEIPAWVNNNFVESTGILAAPYPPRISGLTLPSSQFLWESVYESAAAENNTPERLLSAQMAHPLYHRPLVEFLLALDPEVRRGFDTGRKLQRAAIADRVPAEIANRKSKGSSQELRERHLLESDRWYDLMTSSPQLVERGWVDDDGWRHLIDRARAGAPDMTMAFTAAIDTELWLQTFAEKGFAPVPGY